MLLELADKLESSPGRPMADSTKALKRVLSTTTMLSSCANSRTSKLVKSLPSGLLSCTLNRSCGPGTKSCSILLRAAGAHVAVTQVLSMGSVSASVSPRALPSRAVSTSAQSTPEGRLKVILTSAVGTGTAFLCGQVWGSGEGEGSGEGSVEGEGEASSGAGGGGE
jgi:hypothetical protein